MDNETRIPLYLQIQDHFKRLILSGILQEDERISTEKELMEDFKVSRITVANALAGLAKEGWIYRIPGRGSFVSGKPAGQHEKDFKNFSKDGVYSSNIQKSDKIIGLILPTIDDFFAIRLLRGVGQVITASSYNFVLILTNNVKEREKEAIIELQQMGAVGMLIYPIDEEIYNEEILALKINGFPFVLIDRYFPGVETNFVISDNSKGAQLAVSHLYELGHRNIAICSDVPLPTVTVEERLSGYMNELELRKEMINPALILTDFTVNYQNIQEDHPLFRYIKNRMASSYIATNGNLGMLIYRIAEKLNLRIPEEISIVTFDDPTAEYDGSVFTHISQSEEKMGREAARILVERLESGKRAGKNDYSKVIIAPELIVKQTTGKFTEH